MIIEKVINNNIVVSRNQASNEIIVVGKGLGFKKKINDPIDESLVEKTYVITNEWNVNKLTDMLLDIPLEHVQVANEIISFAKVSLGKKLSENLSLTLTDHIHYAIERNDKGMELKNALLWEIKRFYNHEYLIGKEALNIIESRLNVRLPEDEAGFIALHIVNANLDMDEVGQVAEMTEIIQNILNIVKYHFKIDIDEYSLNYERFVTHLKFFTQRLFSDTRLDDLETVQFMLKIKEQYQNEFSCALKINDYINNKYDRDLEEDELIYLTIHIRRITNIK
ncbi:transcription antiterminator BglG [Vagococcus martis]|uniref:Transcription antiterminator BglG n=1 Tax=Vagococcus martis TaxID=1768210 RepID=A0A1V4DHA3_9ENTE|nr:PRD domain-containing protein [Vagococcus martis]OPF87899.1 transcription antiterminator BglG [Vagococcus martis]